MTATLQPWQDVERYWVPIYRLTVAGRVNTPSVHVVSAKHFDTAMHLLDEARMALEFLLASNPIGNDCNNQRYDGGDEWLTNVDAFRHAKAVLAKLKGGA